MKHERHYEVKQFETPYTQFGTTYNYYLTCTQDGAVKEEKDWFKYETLEKANERCAELNERVYLSDFDEEEIKDFYNSIDFQPLYDKINKAIGLQLTYKNELEKTRDGYRINIESNGNIADMFQIIKAAWKDFKVASFSSQICPDEASRGDLKFWCTIHYAYEHQNGGWNGAGILNARYTSKKGWDIMTELERQEYYKRLEEERYECAGIEG